jgi:hypothetical protein
MWRPRYASSAALKPRDAKPHSDTLCPEPLIPAPTLALALAITLTLALTRNPNQLAKLMGHRAAERITKSRIALSKVCFSARLHVRTTQHESKFADTTAHLY